MKRSAMLALVAFLLLGCGEENLQSQFLVRVSDINGGGPLQADVIVIIDKDTGETGVPEDVVVARITNKPYAPGTITQPETFWNDFQLTSYTVTWRRVDGGPTSGAGWTLSDFDFEGATTTIVPIGGSVETGILLVPAGMKTVPPFNAAVSGAYFKLIADVEFVGHPVVSPDTEFRFQASLSVNVADFVDDEQ